LPSPTCTARSPAGQISGPPFGKQQVDFRRPAPDALDPDEPRDGLLVISGQRRQIEPARSDQFAQRAGIALLLARQAATAQGFASAASSTSGRMSSPSSASIRAQTEAAAATLTCWPTMVRSSVR
jgi:hypothetical protein